MKSSSPARNTGSMLNEKSSINQEPPIHRILAVNLLKSGVISNQDQGKPYAMKSFFFPAFPDPDQEIGSDMQSLLPLLNYSPILKCCPLNN